MGKKTDFPSRYKDLTAIVIKTKNKNRQQFKKID